MDDVILKAWAELSQLALKLNDEKHFQVYLELWGQTNSFGLRVAGHYKGVTYLRLPIATGSEMLSSQIAINANNIKEAKDWLTARHSDMVVDAKRPQR